VSIGAQGDFVSIRVRDTGIGIPQEKQRQLFQRFCQVRPILTRTHEGSGIGLCLVKSLTELHGGTITVESEEGAGTTFSVFLPGKVLQEHELYPANTAVNRMSFEKIQLEFSDIYSARESMIC
jgi:signal transduction histidine kinase